MIEEHQEKLIELKRSVKELNLAHKELTVDMIRKTRSIMGRNLGRSIDPLEADLQRIRDKVEAEHKRQVKLKDFISTLQEGLVKEQGEYSNIVDNYEGDVEEILRFDFEASEAKYFRLMDKKRMIEDQIKCTESLSRRYNEAMAREFKNTHTQNLLMANRIQEQIQMLQVQEEKMKEAKLGVAFTMGNRSKDVSALGNEADPLHVSMVTSRISLSKQNESSSFHSKRSRSGLAVSVPSRKKTQGSLAGLIIGRGD